MNKKQIKALKSRIKSTGLSYRQVYTPCGISKGWFMRMVRGDFIDPNPIWIKRINNYLDDVLAMNTKYKALL